MAFKYDEKDIPKFRAEVCPDCVANGRCDDRDNHWFLMCPKYFNWKIGFRSFIVDNLENQRKAKNS